MPPATSQPNSNGTAHAAGSNAGRSVAPRAGNAGANRGDGSSGAAGVRRAAGRAPAAPPTTGQRNGTSQARQRQNPAPQQQSQRINPRRSDVDGSSWSGRKSDEEIMDLMGDEEDSSTSIAFGAGREPDSEDSGVDAFLNDLGLNDDEDAVPGLDDSGEPESADAEDEHDAELQNNPPEDEDQP